MVPTGCSSPFQRCLNTTSRKSFYPVILGSGSTDGPQSQQSGCRGPESSIGTTLFHLADSIRAAWAFAMRLPFLAHPLPEPLVGGPSFHCPPCLQGAPAAFESPRGIYRHLKCMLKIASRFLNLHCFLLSVRGWNLCLPIVDPQPFPRYKLFLPCAHLLMSLTPIGATWMLPHSGVGEQGGAAGTLLRSSSDLPRNPKG